MTAQHTLLLASPTYRDAIYCMDALAFLRCLPPDSVDCCISSPPYYGLRSYLPDGHPNKPDEIGLQDTPAAFVARLVEVYREVRRVLKPTGVAWMNLGDSYGHGTSATRQQGKRGIGENTQAAQDAVARNGGEAKQLMMIPARVALALQDDGWILRSEIVWCKGSPMPESVRDRPTKAHEMIYMLTKEPRYFYDQDAVRVPSVGSNGGGFSAKYATAQPTHGAMALNRPTDNGTRNLWSYWLVNSEANSFAHFATFPSKLIEPMILAGCPATVCARCGKPHTRVTERAERVQAHWIGTEQVKAKTAKGKHGATSVIETGSYQTYRTVGFAPSCDCNAETVPGVVLDPFMGSGTVALVARRLGRSYIGCDLSSEYVQLCNSRLAEPYTPPMMLEATVAPAPAAAVQVSLW